MALTDFFRINFPYGIRKTDEDKWFAFNREYQPLGSSKRDFVSQEDWIKKFDSVKYLGLSEKVLTELGVDNVEFDDKGKINCIWFYDDRTNPADNAKYWESYANKLRQLSKLKIKKS